MKFNVVSALSSFAMLGLLGLAGVVIATSDTYTSERAQNRVFGSAKAMRVQAGVSNALLHFDLEYLPENTRGAHVGRALLRLNVLRVRKPGTVAVRRVDETWDEDSVSASSSPYLGPVVLDGYPVHREQQREWIDLDVTDLVRDWVDGNVPNHGLAIVPVGDVRVDFASKESKRAVAPELDVILVGGGGGSSGAGAPGPMGPQGPPGPRGPEGERGPRAAHRWGHRDRLAL